MSSNNMIDILDVALGQPYHHIMPSSSLLDVALGQSHHHIMPSSLSLLDVPLGQPLHPAVHPETRFLWLPLEIHRLNLITDNVRLETESFGKLRMRVTPR